LIAVEEQVFGFAEGDGVGAKDGEVAGFANGGEFGIDGGGVDGGRFFTAEAEEDGATGAVAVTGEGEGSRSSRAKRRAARMGPMVWELEGPMPTLKRSKRLVFTKYRVQGSGYRLQGKPVAGGW
jgi:hypothetical protein